MLPQPAKAAIRNSMPSSFWFEVGEGAFPEAPDATEWELTPDLRWANEDFEDDTEPYDHVTLTITTGGVIETNQPLDRYINSKLLTDDTIDADALVEEGQFVYDILSIQANCAGSETRQGLTLTANQRAYALSRAVYRWFRHEWDTRPLDRFDQDGNELPDRSDPYADELVPPIRVDSIPGSGPQDVTESVDAVGAQYNGSVELHYIDSVIDYEYTPTDAELSVVTTQND